MLKHSLILRVLTISFLFLALPLLISIFLMFQIGYNDALQNAKNELRESSTRRSSHLFQIQSFSKSLVYELAYVLDLKNQLKEPNAEKLTKELHKTVNILSNPVEISILGPPTHFSYPIIASTNADLIGKTFFSNYYVSKERNGQISTFLRFEYYPEELQGKYMFFDADEILDDDGNMLGVLLVGNDIGKDIDDIIEVGREFHPHMKYLLTQKDGIIISATNPKLLGEHFFPISQERLEEIHQEMKINGNSKLKIAEQPLEITWEPNCHFFEFTVDGEVQIGHFFPAEKTGLAFTTYDSKKSIFADAVKAFLIIYNGFGLIILLGAAISIWLSSKVAKPLNQLTSCMQKVASGDLSSRFSKQPFGFEINSLGTIFNQTLEALLEQIQNAEDYRIKKESYYKELEIGYEVQRELLPKQMPKVEKVQFSASFIPSNVAHGDFFDCVSKNGQVFLAFADMPTGGISTSFYALNMRSLLRSHVALHEPIEEMATSANALFCKDIGDSKICVSTYLGLYDTTTNTLSSVTAGNHPALIRRKNGAIEIISEGQVPFGLRSDVKYQSIQHTLHSGDMLLLYTKEGLAEAIEKKIIECLKKESLPKPLIDTLTNEIASMTPEKDVLFLALYVE